MKTFEIQFFALLGLFLCASGKRVANEEQSAASNLRGFSPHRLLAWGHATSIPDATTIYAENIEDYDEAEETLEIELGEEEGSGEGT